MPSAWPDEALKAQAVAARSYALAHRLSGKAFDLYADVRSQVYGGIAGEHPRTTAAVDATKAEVLLWEGKPIDALFHSTSGGATLDAAEVFGKPIPYLIGVDDPHSALSPVNRWGPVGGGGDNAPQGPGSWRWPVRSLQLARGTLGAGLDRPRDDDGGSYEDHRCRAALSRAGCARPRVTQLVTLSLTRPGGPVRYGKTVALTSDAQGVKGALVQQRVDGVWTKVAGPALKAKVKLLAPASFRIAAGKLAGSVLKVPVSPFLTARACGPLTSHPGCVKPLAPGAAVELQLETEGTWSTVGTTTTGVEGEYTLVADQAGRYRARVAPARVLPRASRLDIELR